MSTSNRLVWKIRQGDTLRHSFTLKTKESEYSEPEPVDLTGASIRIQIKTDVADDSGTTLISLSTSGSTITTPGDDGKVNVVFTDRSTNTGTGQAALDGAVFDIEVTFPSGDVRTYPRTSIGTIRLIKEVSR